jgi:hypothetical protein
MMQVTYTATCSQGHVRCGLQETSDCSGAYVQLIHANRTLMKHAVFILDHVADIMAARPLPATTEPRLSRHGVETRATSAAILDTLNKQLAAENSQLIRRLAQLEMVPVRTVRLRSQQAEIRTPTPLGSTFGRVAGDISGVIKSSSKQLATPHADGHSSDHAWLRQAAGVWQALSSKMGECGSGQAEHVLQAQLQAQSAVCAYSSVRHRIY